MPPYGGHGWPLFLISLIPLVGGLYGLWDFCVLMVKGESRWWPSYTGQSQESSPDGGK